MASERFSNELALNCDPSQSPIMYVYDYIMNLGLSRCTRLHVCCTGSVVLQENQVMCKQACGLFWPLLTQDIQQGKTLEDENPSVLRDWVADVWKTGHVMYRC